MWITRMGSKAATRKTFEEIKEAAIEIASEVPSYFSGMLIGEIMSAKEPTETDGLVFESKDGLKKLYLVRSK